MKSSISKVFLPTVALAVLFCAAALLCAPQHAEADVEGSIVYLNDDGQYIIYGNYRNYYSLLDEVDIMSYDRSMGVGFIEGLYDTYIIVRLLWLKPEFFPSQATRVRRLFISKLPMIKKEISYGTPIYFDLAALDEDVPEMVVHRVKTTTYGELYWDREVITVEPLVEPWKKVKIPPVMGYIVDPEGKIVKLGDAPEIEQQESADIEAGKKKDTTSSRRRRARKSTDEDSGDDLKEKK